MGAVNRYRRLVGLRVYTTSAALVGTVRDVGLEGDGPGGPGVYLVVETPGGRVGIPLSSVEAVGDIVLVRSGYEALEVGEDGGFSGPAARPPSPAGGGAAGASAAVEPVIPRCPRCGAAVLYDPRRRGRWYCPGCRRYVKLSRSVEARVPRCPACGLPLSYIERYGRWYCYNCRRYVEPGVAGGGRG